jgi:hypothetical protein
MRPYKDYQIVAEEGFIHHEYDRLYSIKTLYDQDLDDYFPQSQLPIWDGTNLAGYIVPHNVSAPYSIKCENGSTLEFVNVPELLCFPDGGAMYKITLPRKGWLVCRYDVAKSRSWHMSNYANNTLLQPQEKIDVLPLSQNPPPKLTIEERRNTLLKTVKDMASKSDEEVQAFVDKNITNPKSINLFLVAVAREKAHLEKKNSPTHEPPKEKSTADMSRKEKRAYIIDKAITWSDEKIQAFAQKLKTQEERDDFFKSVAERKSKLKT